MKLLKQLWRYCMVSSYVRKGKKYNKQPSVSNFYYGKAKYYGSKS